MTLFQWVFVLDVQVKPQTLYLEEEITKNAEFPNEGQFNLPGGMGTYRVCGESESSGSPASAESFPSPSQPGPSGMVVNTPPVSAGWSVPRPWATVHSQMLSSKPNPLNRTRKNQPYTESSLKRSFPYVSLCLDHTGKHVVVENTIDNIYVKVPDSSVSVATILEEVGSRISVTAEDLLILDAKLVPVSSEERGEHVGRECHMEASLSVSLPLHPLH